MGSTAELGGKTEFPALYSLMGGTFHQDFDIDGDTLEQIINSFRRRTPPEAWAEVSADIERFLVQRPDDGQLADDFERLFQPDVIVEGWEGMTTRQFLIRISELLQGTSPDGAVTIFRRTA